MYQQQKREEGGNPHQEVRDYSGGQGTYGTSRGNLPSYAVTGAGAQLQSGQTAQGFPNNVLGMRMGDYNRLLRSSQVDSVQHVFAQPGIDVNAAYVSQSMMYDAMYGGYGQQQNQHRFSIEPLKFEPL